MKKTSIFLFAILLASVINFSYGRNASHPLPTATPDGITTLVVNANVTVVLVNNDNAKPAITGGDDITKFVTLKKEGNTLVIASTKDRNFKHSGVVYVPASQLQEIRINRQAHIKSLYALQVPKLNLVINAECEFSISNIGEINLSSTESYAYLETTEMFRRPAKVLVSRQ